MTWTNDKIDKLKQLWGNGNTASEIAQIIGDVTRNAVIGKANRLNLSSKVIKNFSNKSKSKLFDNNQNEEERKNKTKKIKFKSLIIEKDFEPENPKQLEELTDDLCKYPINHPNEKNFYFCGRGSLKDFSYCKLHLLYSYQSKNKKDELVDKEENPDFIEKKIQSA